MSPVIMVFCRVVRCVKALVISWSSVACCGSVVFLGGMYMLAMWMCLCCERFILVI